MTKKEREQLAYIIKDIDPDIVEELCRVFPGLSEEVAEWQELDEETEAAFKEREKEWVRIAKENGAIIIWGNTLSFQVDGIMRPDLEEKAQKQFKKLHGERWGGGNIIN